MRRCLRALQSPARIPDRCLPDISGASENLTCFHAPQTPLYGPRCFHPPVTSALPRSPDARPKPPAAQTPNPGILSCPRHFRRPRTPLCSQIPPSDGGSPPCWTLALRALCVQTITDAPRIPLETVFDSVCSQRIPPSHHLRDRTLSFCSGDLPVSTFENTPPRCTEIPPPPPHFLWSVFSFLSPSTRDSSLP